MLTKRKKEVMFELLIKLCIPQAQSLIYKLFSYVFSLSISSWHVCLSLIYKYVFFYFLFFNMYLCICICFLLFFFFFASLFIFICLYLYIYIITFIYKNKLIYIDNSCMLFNFGFQSYCYKRTCQLKS